MSSRNVALAGGKVRPAFLMTASVRPKLESLIGRERKEGSARTSRANAGRIAIPKPARTIPTAVIMYVASQAGIGKRPAAMNAPSTTARTLVSGSTSGSTDGPPIRPT